MVYQQQKIQTAFASITDFETAKQQVFCVASPSLFVLGFPSPKSVEQNTVTQSTEKYTAFVPKDEG